MANELAYPGGEKSDASAMSVMTASTEFDATFAATGVLVVVGTVGADVRLNWAVCVLPGAEVVEAAEAVLAAWDAVVPAAADAEPGEPDSSR